MHPTGPRRAASVRRCRQGRGALQTRPTRPPPAAPCSLANPCDVSAYVSKPLDHHPSTRQLAALGAQGGGGDGHDASPGGLETTADATEGEWLTRGHGGRPTSPRRVGVHHPSHDACVGVHVGRQDVEVGADDPRDGVGEGPGSGLQLPRRQTRPGRRSGRPWRHRKGGRAGQTSRSSGTQVPAPRRGRYLDGTGVHL